MSTPSKGVLRPWNSLSICTAHPRDDGRIGTAPPGSWERNRVFRDGVDPDPTPSLAADQRYRDLALEHLIPVPVGGQ